MTGLLDTNVAIHVLGGMLSASLPVGTYGVSVITEMELLAWLSLTAPEESKVKVFLRSVILCELTAGVRRVAVRLRREQRLKLPDAIVCATALEHGTGLWTNEQRLHGVPGLTCRSVAFSAAGSP